MLISGANMLPIGSKIVKQLSRNVHNANQVTVLSKRVQSGKFVCASGQPCCHSLRPQSTSNTPTSTTTTTTTETPNKEEKPAKKSWWNWTGRLADKLEQQRQEDIMAGRQGSDMYSERITKWDRFRYNMRLPPKTLRWKAQLKVSALKLYLCCVELVDYDQFFEEFELPDTFSSWFHITELHMWMVFARLGSESYDGRYIRQHMTHLLWEDCNTKIKKLGPTSLKVRKKLLYELWHQLRYTTFAYDEGLMKDDRVLAAALWQHFLEYNCDDATKLDNLVHYVRKQMVHLDSLETKLVLDEGMVTFLPPEGRVEDTTRSFIILKDIYNRL